MTRLPMSRPVFPRAARSCAWLALLLASGATLAATHTVTQNGDAGVGSLRWAVDQANAAPAGETQEIRFSLAEPFRQVNLASQLLITHPQVSIVGLETATLDSAGRIRIGNPGASGSGVFALSAAVTRFTLRDLDLGPATRTTYRRGACLDAEAVSPTSSQITIERVLFSGCTVSTDQAPVEGGAVYANGSVVIRDALFRDNRVEWLGASQPDDGFAALGGALAMERGLLAVIDSTFEQNMAVARTRNGFENAGGGAVAYTAANSLGMSFTGTLFVDNQTQGIDCGPGLDREAVCAVYGEGGAIYSRASSTVLRRSVFARNQALGGSAIHQLSHATDGFDGRLDLDNVVFNEERVYGAVVSLEGTSARLRQRNVTYDGVVLADFPSGVPGGFFEVFMLTLRGNARVDASHSVLLGRVSREGGGSPAAPLCKEEGPPSTVPIQGNSLVVEPLDTATGTHSCAFLGATRVALADVGIPETGRWDFEPRGFALENGAFGAPSSLDWSRCSPLDAFGRVRNIDGDGDGTASCDVGAVEGLSSAPQVFADGFE